MVVGVSTKSVSIPHGLISFIETAPRSRFVQWMNGLIVAFIDDGKFRKGNGLIFIIDTHNYELRKALDLNYYSKPKERHYSITNIGTNSNFWETYKNSRMEGFLWIDGFVSNKHKGVARGFSLAIILSEAQNRDKDILSSFFDLMHDTHTKRLQLLPYYQDNKYFKKINTDSLSSLSIPKVIAQTIQRYCGFWGTRAWDDLLDGMRIELSKLGKLYKMVIPEKIEIAHEGNAGDSK